jgi:hypothetical protein
MATSKNRTLLLLIAVLLVTNMVMLYLLNREPEKEPELSRSERMVKMVQDELGLTPVQVDEYTKLRNYRDSVMKPIQANMRSAKMEMIQLIRQDSVSQAQLQEITNRVGSNQALMEMEYFNHFKRMQKMLGNDQQPKFDSLLIRMIYRSTGAGDSLSGKEGQKK